jgi:hypothetical protein
MLAAVCQTMACLSSPEKAFLNGLAWLWSGKQRQISELSTVSDSGKLGISA